MEPTNIGPVIVIEKERDADAAVQNLVFQVRKDLEDKIGVELAMCTAVRFGIPMLSVNNYYVKVYVGREFFLHLNIHAAKGNPPQLQGFQKGHTAIDPIRVF